MKKFQYSKTILFSIIIIICSLNFGFTQIEKTNPDSTEFKIANSAKMVYWPTALNLKKGQHYYQNLMLVWHQYHFGVTDKFSMGVSFELISLIRRVIVEDEITLPIISITPKYSTRIDNKVRVGAGAWVVYVPWDDDSFINLGVLYGLITYGTRDNNFTAGIGYGKFEDRWGKIPTLNLGFNFRGKSDQLGISFETWVIENNDDEVAAYFLGSVKYFGKNATFDFGLFKDFRLDILSNRPIPFVGAVFPFNKISKKK